MPFDPEAFLNNPMFQAGASIIGNTGMPGVVGNAFGNMAKINQLKQEADAQRIRAQLEQAAQAETERYHTGQLDLQGKQYERQNQLSQAELKRQARQQALQEAIIRSIGPKLGINIPMPPDEQQPMQQPRIQNQSYMTNGMGRGPGPGMNMDALHQAISPDQLSPEDEAALRANGGQIPPEWMGQVPGARMQQMALKNNGQGGPAQPMQNPSPLQQYGYDALQQNVQRPPAATFDGQTFYEMGPDGMPRARMPGGAHMGGQQPGIPVPPNQMDPANPRGPGPFTGDNRGQMWGAPDPNNGLPMKKAVFGMDNIMNGLSRVESSGNPRAINRQSGAMGEFQFMPGTVDQMRRIFGKDFDPFDPAQARKAAKYLLQQRLAAHGGDLRAALADYGGFVTKDPTDYARKVTRAALASDGQQPQMLKTGGAPQDGGAAPSQQGNAGLDMAQLGALMALSGMTGGNTLLQLGQMMEPKSVQPGSYQKDPASGEMTYVPDPMHMDPETNRALEEQARRLANANAGMNLKKGAQDLEKGGYQIEQEKQSLVKGQQQIAEGGAKAQQEQLKLSKQKATDLSNFQNMNDKLDDMTQLTDKVLNSPGLKYNAGMAGALGLNKIPGTEGRDTMVLMDQLKAKMKVEILQELKSMGKNGSSGFGQLSDRENATLEAYMGNLDKAQSLDQLKETLGQLKVWASRTRSHMAQQYQSTYGETPTLQQQQQGPMSLDDYIKKHQKK